jgi:hypothetical protein
MSLEPRFGAFDADVGFPQLSSASYPAKVQKMLRGLWNWNQAGIVTEGATEKV